MSAIEAVFAYDGDDKDSRQLVHRIHKTIKKVTGDVDRFHLNTAIASIMELVNAVYKYLEQVKPLLEEAPGGGVSLASKHLEQGGNLPRDLRLLKGAVETVLTLLYPFVPHVTAELWMALGKDRTSIGGVWPHYEEAYAVEETVTIAVQINGKLRDTFDADRDAEEGQLKETVYRLEKIAKYLEGKEIKKTIVVPNKLVNIVCV